LKCSNSPRSLFSVYLYFLIGALASTFILSLGISYCCIAGEADFNSIAQVSEYSSLFENYRILRSFLSLPPASSLSTGAPAPIGADDHLMAAIKLEKAEQELDLGHFAEAVELLNSISPTHPFFQDWRKETRLRILWESKNYQGFISLFANPFNRKELDIYQIEAYRQLGMVQESFQLFQTLFRRYPITTFQGIVPESVLQSYCRRLDEPYWLDRFASLTSQNNIAEFNRRMKYARVHPHMIYMFQADQFYRQKNYQAARQKAKLVLNQKYLPWAEAILLKIDYRQNTISNLTTASKKFSDKGQYYSKLCWDLANITLTESKFSDALYFFHEFIGTCHHESEDFWKAIWLSAWLEYRLGNKNGAKEMFGRGMLAPAFGYRVACKFWLSRLTEKSETSIDIYPLSYYAMKTYGNSLFSRQTIEVFKHSFNQPVSGDFHAAKNLILSLWNGNFPDVVERFCLWYLKNHNEFQTDREMITIVQSILLYHRGEFLRSHSLYKRYSAIADQSLLPPILQRIFFPLSHQETIFRYSTEFNVDPFLISAIIREESFFQNKAVSSANAIGMMQLLLPTARDIAKKIGTTVKREDLFDPDINIQLGILYFRSLLDKYNGKVYLALAAYNAGDFRVDRWLQENSDFDEEEFIELIPFSQTRNYVKNILLSHFIYRYYHERS